MCPVLSGSNEGSVLNAPNNLNYEFGEFLLEPHARRLSRHGEPVALAGPEFDLLLLLVRNQGRIVEKREIMDAVWPDAAVEENNLTVRMSSLRRSLGETKGHHPYIQTVTGRGYCLITPVKELPAQPGTETVANAQFVRPAAGGRPKFYSLYAVFGVGLLATSLIYGVLRRQSGGESQVLAQPMRMSRATQTGRVAWAALSPDGQNIAYVEREGELHSLWLQRVATNNPLQLLPPAKITYKEPAFSRDGNWLYYSKCQPKCQLHRMPVLGGVETALPVRADSPVTFSPDGKRMAYMRVSAVGTGVDVSLLVANADGTGEEALNSRSSGTAYQYGAPAWSPDGKSIAVHLMVDEGEKTNMKVIEVRVVDRVVSTLTSQRWRYIKDVAWLPDSNSLIINGRDEASNPEPGMQIWRVPLTGGEARRITNDLNNYMRIGVSADGSTLIALQVQATSGLWIAPAENPTAATQVTRGTMDRQDGNLGLSIA